MYIFFSMYVHYMYERGEIRINIIVCHVHYERGDLRININEASDVATPTQSNTQGGKKKTRP